MSVTSLEYFKKATEGTAVDIPGHTEGEVITLRLKRTSLFSLIKEGKIPNPLLPAAQVLFNVGTGRTKEKEITLDILKENEELMQIIAKDTLVEPTYAELEGVGYKLTEEQLGHIFQYAQGGVKLLEKFRKK